MAFGEVVVGTIGIADGNEVRESLKLHSIHLLLVHIDLRIGETFQFAGVVSMLVCNQYFRHLFRLVAKGLEGIHIATDVLAGINGRVLVGHFLWKACRQAGIHQNHFATRINQIVLKSAAIADVLIKLVLSFLASEHEGLGIESVLTEFYCFDFHKLKLLCGLPLAADGRHNRTFLLQLGKSLVNLFAVDTCDFRNLASVHGSTELACNTFSFIIQFL